MMMNETTLIFDLTKDIIPAELIAKIHGKNETTIQKEERIEKELTENAKRWKMEMMASINAQLIQRGIVDVTIESSYNYRRKDLVAISAEIRKAYASKGYKTNFYEYATSNRNLWCRFAIMA